MSGELTASERGVPAVETLELVKIYGSRRVVDGISMALPVGKVYGILGPNGAGKTTTINMLTTLLKPDQGVAKVFGHDVRKDAGRIRQLIGLTGQYAALDEKLSGFENLYIFARLQGFTSWGAKKKAAALLADFELSDSADKQVEKYSGGMRRRLDLAASLISTPPLLFLDEPTTGLDPRNRAKMWELIRALVAGGTTVLLTTQYLDEADNLADRIAVIDQGKIVAEGTANELKASIGSTSLHLRLADRREQAQAARMVEKVLRSKSTLTEESVISAPMKNPDQVTELLMALRREGIVLSEISVQKPTLDEVFLTLTGKGRGTDEKEAGHGQSDAA
jgi:ABC-2 type transport system ATP-binding protein